MIDPFDVLRQRPGRTEPSPAFRNRVLAAARAELDAIAADRATGPAQVGGGGPGQAQLASEVPGSASDLTVLSVAELQPAVLVQRRRRFALAALVAAAALVAVTIVAANRTQFDDVDTGGPSTTGSSIGTTASSTSVPAAVEDGLPPLQPLAALGGSSSVVPPNTAILGGGDTLLVGRGNIVEVLDPSTGAVLTSATLPVEWDVGVALTGGALWAGASGTGPALSGRPGTVYRFDPATGSTVTSIEVPDGLRPFGGLVPDAQGTGLWSITLGAPAGLVHVSAETNTVDAVLTAPDRTTAIGLSPGSLWAARAGGAVSRLDLADGGELAVIDTPLAEPLGVQVRGDQVWVFGYDDRQRAVLAKIDATANTLAAWVVVGGPLDLMRGYGFDVADGSVWIHTEQAQLVQVDQDSATVVARYGDAPGGGGVIATEDALWLATGSTNTLYRLPRR